MLRLKVSKHLNTLPANKSTIVSVPLTMQMTDHNCPIVLCPHLVKSFPQVLEGKTQYMEFSGNLVPVLKSGEQLQLPFRAFKENRVPFTARIKDPDAADMMGRIMFMSEPKVPKGELPQVPICTLNILLPEKISPETAVSEVDLLELSKNYSFLRDGGIST